MIGLDQGLDVTDLGALAVPGQPALSRDGRCVVYVLRTHDLNRDTTRTALWLVEAASAPRPLTLGPADTCPTWSPDGAQIAFLRAGQVWLIPAWGGEPRQVSTVSNPTGAPVWRPDGRALAFAAPLVEPAVSDRTATVGGLDAAPVVADGIDYQLDGARWTRRPRSEVHVIDLLSGETRQVTHGSGDAYQPFWSPDGTSIAYLAKAPHHNDLSQRMSVCAISLDDPAQPPRVLAFRDGLARSACFTPDGDALLVAGWAAELRGPSRLYLADPLTRRSSELSTGDNLSVVCGGVAVPGAPPLVVGEEAVFCARSRGATHLYAVPLVGGEVRQVAAVEGGVVTGLSAADGKLAISRTNAGSFGEIGTVDPATGTWAEVTVPRAVPAPVEIVRRISREFVLDDGSVVQGWIIRDRTTAGAGPLLLDIHGGPHGAWDGAADEYHLYQQELAALGWTVLLLNPRGSDGYGGAFYDAVYGSWGHADRADLLEPVDQLVAEGLADPARLAVTGFSYGGYQTCSLIAHDQRFAAAVAGGAIVDLISFGGTSDEARLIATEELGLFPWRREDRAGLAELSPYTRVDQVDTPTLLLHGELDRVCPVGQAQQWHHALRERGVPSRLVIYPGAGHGMQYVGRPSHRVDYQRRLVDWVTRHVGQRRASGSDERAMSPARRTERR